ncbi:MAG: Gfo/Idh/MocA family oxidoreductase [Hyphomicrobiales bacterium]|nr:Gfo/Idh/MocA family oxidoreductase [Hyphomicrobiales bacterium]
MDRVRIGVVGAGAIGRMHVATIAASDCALACAVADPAPEAEGFARELGIPYFADHRTMMDVAAPDAVIVAAPNDLHVPIALDAIARKLPVLVEKPIASTLEDGETLVRASTDKGAPVLVGHHRRHNPVIAEARRLVRGGAIGAPTLATILSGFYKPAEYFDLQWRRRIGAGPVLINLIHEIDLVRFICGEIAEVQAMSSNARRGYEVEDTAGVLLRLHNGALVTISLSDTVAAPWSWDLSSGELPSYPPQTHGGQSHFFCGVDGSLTLPSLEHWSYKGKKSWHSPIARDLISVERASPYLRQLRHLCAVMRGEEQPIVDATDGLRTLRATLAVHEAARSGRPVRIQD